MIVEMFICDVSRDYLLFFTLSFTSVSLVRFLHGATNHSMKYIVWSKLLKYFSVCFMYIKCTFSYLHTVISELENDLMHYWTLLVSLFGAVRGVISLSLNRCWLERSILHSQKGH
jgi:hypothetical protein